VKISPPSIEIPELWKISLLLERVIVCAASNVPEEMAGDSRMRLALESSPLKSSLSVEDDCNKEGKSKKHPPHAK
jgi:hypothetical protein